LSCVFHLVFMYYVWHCNMSL